MNTKVTATLSPATAAALKAWVVLNRAQAAVARHSDADLARHELTSAEFAVLDALYALGPQLLGDLQRKVLVSSGGVTYLVDRLSRRGLVERQPCPGDRRARYAALTATGRTLMRRIFPEHAEAIARALAPMGKAPLAAVTALLRELGKGAAGIAPAAQG